MARWIYYTKRLAHRWEREAATRKEPVVIALDAMGGDHGVVANLDGALLAVADQPGLVVKLIGREPEIMAALKKTPLPKEVEIIHADDVFEMHEPATLALKRPESSIMRGIELLKENKAHGFVSMGNTGAVVAVSLVKLGRIKKVERPALMTLFPTLEGLPTVVLDIGANVDCKPEHLLQFAMMGNLYAEEVLDRKNPKVALLSVGTEETKGNIPVKEAHKLIKELNLNFVGNIEGGDVIHGKEKIQDIVAFLKSPQ